MRKIPPLNPLISLLLSIKMLSDTQTCIWKGDVKNQQYSAVLRLQQQWVILREKLSLYTQFEECSGKDRQLEPIVAGWQMSHAHHYCTYLETKCCQGEELSSCERASVGGVSSKCLVLRSDLGQLSLFPSCLLPWKKPLRTINNLHRSLQCFHSHLWQQTSELWVDHIFEHRSKVSFPDGEPEFQ